ncbi:MAG: hypothetical protein PHU46_00310 [Rhodocyclaceae bacterium]|nr:hypothetical protein [Rhodocyclaceae bacterium]
MRKLLRLTGALITLACAAFPAGATNVLLNATVTAASGGFNGAPLSTVADGILRGNGTQWQNGTVWWNGTSPVLDLQLQSKAAITGFFVEADNNDTYRIDYMGGDSLWHTAWDVPYAYNSGGMNARAITLGSAIVASELRFYATAGDNSYSVSEIQADGTAIPEPRSLALAAAGLALVGWFARRR